METDSSSLNLSSELLGLSDTEVTKVEMNTVKTEISITVKSTKESVDCRICGRATNGHGLGRHLRLRHLPLLGKRTFIEIKPRRGICQHCKDGPTTTEALDWYKVHSPQIKAYEQHQLFN